MALQLQGTRAGLPLEMTPLPGNGRLLHVQVDAPDITLRGLLAVDSMLPALPAVLGGLAWPAIVDPDALLAPWPTPFTLPFPCAALAQAVLRVCPGMAAVNTLPACMPAVHSAHGPLWLTHIDSRAPAPPSAGSGWHLPATLHLRIARLVLPAGRCTRLAAGAVLLLPPLVPVGMAGGRQLFTFDFTLETCTVRETLDFLDDTPVAADAGTPVAPPSTAPAAPTLDLARFPVTVEVILSQVPQTVGDLAGLLPGTVFQLPADAWTALQLRANGQTIANGELVQVGEQLGVLLHQALRQP